MKNNNLDDNLKFILQAYKRHVTGQFSEKELTSVYPQSVAIAALKQAFADAGYVNDDKLNKLFADFERMTAEAKKTLDDLKTKSGYVYTGKDELSRVMTGQEWYHKYRKLCMMSGYYSDDLPMMKLARKAAGIE